MDPSVMLFLPFHHYTTREIQQQAVTEARYEDKNQIKDYRG